MNALLVAVDPGASGGVAWFQPGKGVQAAGMPKSEDGFCALALEIKGFADGLPVRCYVEKVGGFIKPEDDEDRENRQPGHAMFTFGRNTGAIITAFRATGAIIVDEIHPRTWQQPLFVKRGGKSKSEWKRTLKNIAQRKFPGIKVTLKTADALLLLYFASLRESATLPPGDGQTHADEAPSAGNGVNSSAPGLRLVDWKGSLWVERDGKRLLRRATPGDIATLPKR